jgi:hypothetical protein
MHRLGRLLRHSPSNQWILSDRLRLHYLSRQSILSVHSYLPFLLHLMHR